MSGCYCENDGVICGYCEDMNEVSVELMKTIEDNALVSITKWLKNKSLDYDDGTQAIISNWCGELESGSWKSPKTSS